jgi:hypothetical protein
MADVVEEPAPLVVARVRRDAYNKHLVIEEALCSFDCVRSAREFAEDKCRQNPHEMYAVLQYLSLSSVKHIETETRGVIGAA